MDFIDVILNENVHDNHLSLEVDVESRQSTLRLR